ncbi:DUF4247 domain-containing protein [Paenibacillus sp. MWE-103]|uniref:DUF4247 domain-containing protein n=1 Tax=Paenibacillus artemisiicola TaxID=1172618 RepID=A0ABS3W9A0_9BACL|nr:MULTISPECIES: DUF4247 domain-containing protein [Paenibacillus]MBO7744907.1 DUF4247 domain-containing protein [Paenibacillus artemisiicola]SFI28086.1 protein of unknown function [Paenibacillus sp. UNC496MF]
MRSKGSYLLKFLLVFTLVFPLLAACGVNQKIEEQYPLESVNGSGASTSYVYRAAGVSVPEVAKALVDQQKPQQESAEAKDHMFLVYNDRIIHLQQDTEKPEDTLIEVDSQEYVRQNYSSSFLEGYLLASFLGNLFDNGRYGHGSYRGYDDRGTYKPTGGSYHAPTAQEKKAVPPMTVTRTGSIFKRSKNADTTSPSGAGSVTSNPSKGKITRDTDGGKKSGSWLTPRKSSKPKTRVGFGRVSRRR